MANPVPKQLTPFGPNNPPPKSPGRPKKRVLSETYEEWLRTEVDEPIRKAMGLPKGALWADAVTKSMLRQAVLKGSEAAAKELREATEGKAPMRITAQIETSKRTEIVVVYDDAPAQSQVEDAIDVTPRLPESTGNNEEK